MHRIPRFGCGEARQVQEAGADFPIAIIGAGFAGIGMAIQLEKAGIDSYTLFERAGEIGGTWRDNTYPGAACDVPSHLYSLSFEQTPDWRREYSEADEIQAYLLRLVDKWQLREKMRLDSEIVSARFDEAAGAWTLTTRLGESFTARVVIAGVGGLVDPAFPAIEGMANFAGQAFHSARWNRDVDLGGKRVAVIGTGASAVQIVPSIAPFVSKLSVFQRTPAWVVPKQGRVYSDAERRRLQRSSLALRWSRLAKYGLSELRAPLVMLDAPRLSAIGEKLSLDHLHAQVRDPVLREQLRPAFQFGCKRILISDDYWAVFERGNVELVTDPIREIRAGGIATEGGAFHALDAVIYATGFEVGFRQAAFEIIGRGGRSLEEVWRAGAVAYKGIAVAGFPNWFTLMGPNTGPGHTSVLIYTEAQISHVLQAIRKLRARRWRSVEVRQAVQDRYNAGIQRRMRHMVWSGCKSWYQSEDGSNRALYPGFAAEYVLRARRFNARDYEIARF